MAIISMALWTVVPGSASWAACDLEWSCLLREIAEFIDDASIVADEPPPAPATEAPDVFSMTEGGWENLPDLDPRTLAELESLVPGKIDRTSVKQVTPVFADSILAAVIARKETYLDLLTHEGLRGSRAYYTPSDVLEFIDRKYRPGTLPLSGKDTQGRFFRMKALFTGQGRIVFIYDRGDFKFEEGGRTYAIDGNGPVQAWIQAPGDVTISGFSVKHGMLWPKFQRIVKISAYMARYETNWGSGEGPVSPIQAK